MPPLDVLRYVFQRVLAHAVQRQLRIDVESVPLADITHAWNRESRRRLVIVP
jgi:hypothetical protein